MFGSQAGKAAIRTLLLHAAVRVVPEPASRLDTFATGDDIAKRIQAEVDGNDEGEGRRSLPVLRVAAVEHALLLLEGWLQPYRELRPASIAVGDGNGTGGGCKPTHNLTPQLDYQGCF